MRPAFVLLALPTARMCPLAHPWRTRGAPALPTCLPAHLAACLPACSPTHQPSHLPTWHPGSRSGPASPANHLPACLPPAHPHRLPLWPQEWPSQPYVLENRTLLAECVDNPDGSPLYVDVRLGA